MKQKKLSQKFSQQLFRKLFQKMSEVSEVQPQTIGPLTPVYKSAVRYLKISPWKILLPVSFLFSLFALKLLGSLSIRLVSVLQQAF